MRGRILAALAAFSVCVGPSAPVGAALAVPMSPDNPAVSGLWVNPAIRPGEGEQATVELVSAPHSLSAHDPITLTVRVANKSQDTLSGLTVTPRLGPATGSVADQRTATVADVDQYQVAGRTRDVDKQLAPGESTELTFTVLESELPLAGITTYPLLIALQRDGVVLDTERFHLAVRGTTRDANVPGLSALYPVSAPIDIVPGETGEAPDDAPLVLGSETLADELAPGGRLDQLVDVYAQYTSDPGVAEATCMSIDPALVDTAERMSHGYTVSSTRPDVVEEPKRLRDSWGSANNEETGEAGRGASDAASWLEKVRQAAGTGCVVALPWANADLNAVARTGDVWLMREAIERGPFTLQEILGTAGVSNTVVPAAGYVDQGVGAALGWADHTRSMVGSAGMQAAWEETLSGTAQGTSGRVEDEQTTTLERSDLPGVGTLLAPPPNQTVRVLVASDTAPHSAAADSASDRFSWIAPGVMAVEYDAALSTVLASAGPVPETTGYSRVNLRSNLTQDSALARAINAGTAVRLAAQSSWRFGDTAATPVLINPPATWDATAADTIMAAVRELLGGGGATPLTLDAYASAPAADTVSVATSTGSPSEDPAVYSDAEVLAAGQQSRYTNDLSALLVPDPSIALSRYGFTLPLRRDLLIALGVHGRRSLGEYSAAQDATSRRLAGSRDTLNELGASVALIPPGNVYTRTSPSSPLLIVAENGLPLPVDTTILYRGPGNARLNVPGSLRIPAHGSVTVQMTADLPDEQNTDLQLFLASPQGQPISQPVHISVRTSGIALQGWVIVASAGVVLALLILFRVGKRRRTRGPTKPVARADIPAQRPSPQRRQTPS
ncbi:hypothetical protein CAPI_09520 [Corynebacterium capitovis DSM 44611]|uniref:hypothetical protein n=1 Tax=Corynebacterium capitovis TaxID=131081 RepID=UPI00036B6AA8|nr:hypothetical protein [Corynebacterium capitovis]WKD58427.1 hypothetical protein CAPI_09520 [Corynebacterium capitovis DSM 44611]